MTFTDSPRTNEGEQTFVNVDDLGRAPVGSRAGIGRPEDSCYQVYTYADGTIVLTPRVPWNEQNHD